MSVIRYLIVARGKSANSSQARNMFWIVWGKMPSRKTVCSWPHFVWGGSDVLYPSRLVVAKYFRLCNSDAPY